MKRSRRARGPGLKPKDLPRFLLLTGAALAVAWLCLQSAVAEGTNSRYPAPALAIAPNDPRVVFRLAKIELRLARNGFRPQTLAAVRSAFESAPLVEDPFVIGAIQKIIEKDEAGAKPLLAEARRRNPRSRETRLILLDRYLRDGQAEAAADEITALSGLLPEAREVLVPELAKFAKDPRTRSALERAIRTDTGIRDLVLQHLASGDADPRIILELAQSGGAPAASDTPPAWQASLLQSLVDRGDVGRAYLLWKSFSAVEAAPGAIYNPSFQKLPGLGPFNWVYSAAGAGVAEPTGTSGLQIDYYGREAVVLASQLVQFPSGQYRLSTRAEGQSNRSGTGLAWSVSCLESKSEIARLPISQLSFAGRSFRGTFTIPPGNCSAQWLRLIGTPREFPVSDSATINAVEITKAPRK